MTKEFAVLLATITTTLALMTLLSLFQDTSNILAAYTPQSAAPFFLPYEGDNWLGNTVVDAAGGVHVAYESIFAVGDITPIYYAYCAATCDEPTNWGRVTVGDARLGGSPALAVTPAGQPRLLWYYQQTALGSGDYIYAACDVDCLTAANWAQLTVATTKSSSRRNLTLTPQGQPRFVYPDLATLHKGLFYSYCDADCTTAGSWAETKIDDRHQIYDIEFVADTVGTLHLSYNYDNSVLEYGQCGTNCATATNWASTPLLNIGLEADIALAVTANNQPRLALYSGYYGDGDPANNRLLYSWCDTDCALSGTNWANWGVGLNEGEGAQLDLALDSQNQPHIVYHASSWALGYVACRAGCEFDHPVWDNQYVETAAQLNAAEPAPQACLLEDWSWDVGQSPAIALDDNGQVFIGYVAI